MPKLRTRIIVYLLLVFLLVSLLILVQVFGVLAVTLHSDARQEAETFFSQLDYLLADNQADLEQVHAEFDAACERKVRAAAVLLGYADDAPTEAETLEQIVQLLELRELRLYDGDGVQIGGSDPAGLGTTLRDSGDLRFFLPLLEDKTLCLTQEILPAAEGRDFIQYTGVWDPAGAFLVLVGVDPNVVLREIEKNTLPHILALLRAGSSIELYAFHPETRLAEGSTCLEDVGKDADALGFEDVDFRAAELEPTHVVLHGERSYCVFGRVQGHLICYVTPRHVLYGKVGGKIALTAGAMVLSSVFLMLCVLWYLDRHVLRSIYRINASLNEITSGNLEERIDVNDTREFYELSKHINDMINSVLGTTDILSYIINKTEINIGVYIYDTRMHYVRVTDQVPELLRLDKEKMRTIYADFVLFREYLRKIRRDPVEGERHIYRFPGAEERYLRIDEAVHLHYVLGIIIDMTDDMARRRRIESERDMDPLTGMLNRYGLRNNLQALFAQPDRLGSSAMLMIDADDLKRINDVYGHSQGDRYLIALSKLFNGFGRCRNLCARLGGDEFVLFLYGYRDEAELERDLEALTALQDSTPFTLRDGTSMMLRFSIGCARTSEEGDFSALLRLADERMYAQKRKRKGQK